MTRILASLLLALLLAHAALAQTVKVLTIKGIGYVDAVESLGCVQGVGSGTGNAAKINTYLASRPKYPVYIPGGALELDDTIVIPAQSGSVEICGNGQGADLNDSSYTGATQGGQPTRVIWGGAADKPMFRVDSRFGSIHDLTLQARPMPSSEPANTGVKARIGIHVRTANESGIPTGKQTFNNITFHGLPCGILFGADLDTSLATVGSYNNADETKYTGLHFYYPYNSEGYGTGTLTTRTSATAGVVTLGASHGITQGNYCDLTWTGGARTGMLVTGVSGAAVTLSGGYGTDLPAQDTAITGCTEERTCIRTRTHQAVGFTGGHMQVNGHCDAVWWFEYGGKLFHDQLSISGDGAATRQQDILRLGGGLYPGGFDIGLNLDATSKVVKLVNCTSYFTATNYVHMRVFNSDPSGGGNYSTPLFTIYGAAVVSIEGMRRIPDNAIELKGSPGNVSNRQKVAIMHLYDCDTNTSVDWPTELIKSSSTGPYWLTWDHLVRGIGGTADSSGYESQPYEDGETSLDAAATSTLTKIAAP